jgi:hypothetical protein
MIAPLQLPGYAAPQTIDWTSLDRLGTTLQTNRINNDRQQALSLATLGQTPGAQPDYGKSVSALIGAGDLEGAAKIAAIQKAVSPESSADLQAYKVARGQGFTGGILDFLKDKAAAGATRVNNSTVVQSGEKAYDTAVGKDYADVFTTTQKAARDSVGAINNLNLMENLTKNPNFYSGAAGNLVTQGKKIAASLGIADANSAAPNELFQKIGNKAVLDAAGGSLGTGFSNADRDFLSGTVPNIGNTPEGNRQIIAIARTVEQRKQQVAQFARDYAKKHSGRIDAGFDQALQEWSNAHPAFSQAQRGSQPAQAPQQPQAAPQQGQPRQAPDGNFYVPDPNRPGKYLQVIQ